MKSSRGVRARSALNALLFLSLVCALRAQAQNSPVTIKQLFAFGCDSSTKICPDGQNPNWLIQSADGNFYGTRTTGGVGNHAGGTVFKLSPRGNLTVVFTFVANAQGNYPEGFFPNSLVEGNDGFLYGTTLGGGSNSVGVIFKLSKARKIQVLHSLCDSCGESAEPGHLILATDGDFYGVTQGTVFRITPAGSFTSLVGFSAYQPPLGIVQASDGNLYGTTIGGRTLLTPLFRLSRSGQFATLHTPQGERANGVVFALDAALAPPKPGIVGFNPSSGGVGSKVMIHGSHFVGTRAVPTSSSRSLLICARAPEVIRRPAKVRMFPKNYHREPLSNSLQTRNDLCALLTKLQARAASAAA